MSSDNTGPADGAPSASSRRRVLLAVAGALVVLALVVTGLVVGGGEESSPSGASSSPGATAAPGTTGAAGTPTAPVTTDPAPAPSATGTGTPTGPVGADVLPEALPAVGLDESVSVAGVTASITRVEAIEGQATQPGDVAGPALRVTVRIENPGEQAASVDGVTVNVYSGSELTPAPPLGDPTQSPLAGTVPAGASAEGVYVFRVSLAARSDVTVEVGYRAGDPLAVFRGAVG